ncbi:hypothetical protein D3C85_161090 [compost metagenome]
MPITSSIVRRQAMRDTLDTPTIQATERWNGIFQLIGSFRRVKARTEPSDVYMAYDDRRAMHALVDAYANVMLDVLTTKAAVSYAGEELECDADQVQFASEMVGWKLTFIGEAQLVRIAELLEASKLSHRYSIDDIGQRAVDWFNDRRPLGPEVVATIEYKDVVLKRT